MRYPVEKIKAALFSPNANERSIALEYFTSSFSQDPSILIDVFRAIDQYSYKFTPTISEIANLKQSEASLDWIIGRLNAVPKDDSESALLKFLEQLVIKTDRELLMAREESLVASPYPSGFQRVALNNRLEVARWDEARCWSELEREIGNLVSDSESYNPERVELIIQDLAGQCDPANPRIMQALNRPFDSIEDDFDKYMMPCYAELAGRLGMRQAVPRLLELITTDDEFLHESCRDALIRIGDPEIVPLISKSYDSVPSSCRTFIAEILAGFKSDLSTSHLRLLLDKEDDTDHAEFLMHGLLLQFDTDLLQPVFDKIQSDDIKPWLFSLYESLIVLSDLMEVRFDGYEQSMRINEEHEEFVKRKMQEMLTSQQDWLSQIHNSEETANKPQNEYSPVTTIVKGSDHVGRNDPCPCGSGKKFKKCCINKSGNAIRD